MKIAIKQMRDDVTRHGYTIQTQNWQGKDNPPEMLERLHVNMMIPMLNSVDRLGVECNAKLPWADIHFQERVGGKPLNPPPSHKMWARDLESFYATGYECFSHSYPERLWSKKLHSGIRYDIADLNTLVEVLKKDPTTRQAYLPFFFPEDLTASLEGERVPCSLGWHFIIRNGQMDMFYALRSCDVMRHLHNDLYFANRLVLWVIEQTGLAVLPGDLHFVATSLHCFSQDVALYEKGLIK